MSELSGTAIRTTAVKLGLPHLAEALNQYIQRADEAKMGYLDFLDLVLAEELAVRDDRPFRQDLRLSRLPHHKTLEDFDFDHQRSVKRAVIAHLGTLDFVVGKEHVSARAGFEAGR